MRVSRSGIIEPPASSTRLPGHVEDILAIATGFHFSFDITLCVSNIEETMTRHSDVLRTQGVQFCILCDMCEHEVSLSLIPDLLIRAGNITSSTAEVGNDKFTCCNFFPYDTSSAHIFQFDSKMLLPVPLTLILAHVHSVYNHLHFASSALSLISERILLCFSSSARGLRSRRAQDYHHFAIPFAHHSWTSVLVSIQKNAQVRLAATGREARLGSDVGDARTHCRPRDGRHALRPEAVLAIDSSSNLRRNYARTFSVSAEVPSIDPIAPFQHENHRR